MQKLISICCTILFWCNSSIAQEQFTVTGKVIDFASKQALAGASVFCQNTTFGVITNADGEFRLSLPKGGYDLVVSYTGLQSSEQRINSGSTEPLVIEMKPKDQSMDVVTVAGSNEVPDGWVKYGDFFKEQFLGVTASAPECELLNPEALRFFYSKKRNRLKVLAKEELKIRNNALGYTIRYQLDSLSYEYGTQISTYSGYPFFEPLSGTPEQESRWANNRRKAYNGSKLHFMRSWHDSTLQQEGFAIEKVVNPSRNFESVPVENYYDTSFFAIDSGAAEIMMTGKYRVIYRKEMPDPKFVSFHKLPPHIKVQLSIVDINDSFIIEENGYWYQQSDLVNSGYWSYERVAEAVPYDYRPN